MNRRVSVVTAVRDGGPSLASSLSSVLNQEGVDLELIVVDDGSTDETPGVLASLARRDRRVLVMRQERAGQTRALIAGCAAASGDLIARHDAGDLSLPGRLRAEVDLLGRAAGAALVSCGTRFVGPRGELLYEIRQDPAKATASLLGGRASQLEGPSHHGATMFRRSLYEAVGGYRPDFPVAQDLDLWVRLAERAEHRVVPTVLYEATVTPSSVSQRFRPQQLAATGLIAESARLRRTGKPDSAVLARARGLRLGSGGGRLATARACYFIGRCLQERDDPRGRDYLRRAFAACPWHVKSALSLLFP